MGRPAHDSAARLIEATGIPMTVDELLTTMDQKLDSLFRTVEPLPGVVKLVHHLEKHKVPMAVSTRTGRSRWRFLTAPPVRPDCHWVQDQKLQNQVGPPSASF